MSQTRLPCRARPEVASLIRTTTGSATAITPVYPKLAGRLNGHAVRMRLSNASLSDALFQAKRETTAKDLNTLFGTASDDPMTDILGDQERPLVLTDYTNAKRSGIVDAP